MSTYADVTTSALTVKTPAVLYELLPVQPLQGDCD
jgi:hypothetical protein